MDIWRRRELRWERKKVWEKDKGREEEKGKKKKNRTPGRCKRNREKLKLMRERAQREEFGNSRRQV